MDFLEDSDYWMGRSQKWDQFIHHGEQEGTEKRFRGRLQIEKCKLKIM